MVTGHDPGGQWVIEGEMMLVLVLSDGEVTFAPRAVVVQRGTHRAWDNRPDAVTRIGFFHIAAEFRDELLARLRQPLEPMA